MPKNLNSNDFREHLREQISFLQASAKLYDLGTEAESKRMAVVLRVLLYDSKASASLLGQMHLKKQMQFVSTAQRYIEQNLVPQQCLLFMRIDQNSGKFIPLFQDDECKYRLIRCTDWSSEIILTDKHRTPFRRKDLIELLANKDGGAHVDPKINDDLAALKAPNLTGWKLSTPDGKERGMDNDAVYASMRQMAFEVLQSLYRIRPLLFAERYF